MDAIVTQAHDTFFRDLQTIVLAIEQRDSEPWSEAAGSAFNRVYSRLHERLFAYCHRFVNRGNTLPADYTVEMFFKRAFWRLLAGLRCLKLSADLPSHMLEQKVCWFFKKPVEWTLADIRREERLVELPDLFKEASANRGRFGDQASSPEYIENRRQLRLLLERLPEKDRDILLTASSYTDIETGEVNLPAEVQSRLLRDYSFNSANSLNQYRKRRFEALRKAARPVA
jgi:hypothetical protein